MSPEYWYVAGECDFLNFFFESIDQNQCMLVLDTRFLLASVQYLRNNVKCFLRILRAKRSIQIRILVRILFELKKNTFCIVGNRFHPATNFIGDSIRRKVTP
jgi:hypothetical protein